MRLWKTAVALVLFCIVLLYVASKTTPKSEGFEDIADIQQFIQQIQSASGQLGETKTYDDWIGWLYTHPEGAAKALNDFKMRVFKPECKFRNDWSSNLPAGKLRPNPAKTAQLANIAYRSYLDCLAKRNSNCILLLGDARERFMQPDCDFLNPSDVSSYNRDVTEVFK
jgi:hypothetical protein